MKHILSIALIAAVFAVSGCSEDAEKEKPVPDKARPLSSGERDAKSKEHIDKHRQAWDKLIAKNEAAKAHVNEIKVIILKSDPDSEPSVHYIPR